MSRDIRPRQRTKYVVRTESGRVLYRGDNTMEARRVRCVFDGAISFLSHGIAEDYYYGPIEYEGREGYVDEEPRGRAA